MIQQKHVPLLNKYLILIILLKAFDDAIADIEHISED
jgi:hypothetical protein